LRGIDKAGVIFQGHHGDPATSQLRPVKGHFHARNRDERHRDSWSTLDQRQVLENISTAPQRDIDVGDGAAVRRHLPKAFVDLRANDSRQRESNAQEHNDQNQEQPPAQAHRIHQSTIDGSKQPKSVADQSENVARKLPLERPGIDRPEAPESVQ
jgi:hypothetical protein